MTDPLLALETSSEEEASWLAASELDADMAQAWVRRAEAVARGYVLAARQGRGDLAVADVMGSFALDRRSAEAVLGEALCLVAHPATVAAVEQRRLPLPHARALLHVLLPLPDAVADQVEAEVLRDVEGRSPARVRELARREVLRVDPEGAAQRRRKAHDERNVSLRDAGNGMVSLTLLLRAEQGLQVLHRAERETQHDDGSGRTRDQRRLDWVVDRLLSEDAPTPGTDLVPDGRRRRPVQVLVHVPVTTALGLDDAPCDLAEVGAIDAEHGRLLLATAELRKVCVDATTGQVVHVDDDVVRTVADPRRVRELGGTDAAACRARDEAVQAALLDMLRRPSVVPVDPEPQYRPSASLSRTVKTRHPRCDFLTCTTPSRSCDDEHTRPHPDGETSADNLRPRSRWCHRAKQRGWTPLPRPDGTTLWKSPSGRQYAAPAQHRPPPVPLPKPPQRTGEAREPDDWVAWRPRSAPGDDRPTTSWDSDDQRQAVGDGDPPF